MAARENVAPQQPPFNFLSLRLSSPLSGGIIERVSSPATVHYANTPALAREGARLSVTDAIDKEKLSRRVPLLGGGQSPERRAAEAEPKSRRGTLGLAVEGLVPTQAFPPLAFSDVEESLVEEPQSVGNEGLDELND